jgi:hydroxymethylbilane synthase
LKPLRIGTRASALARWQAESVQAQLAALGCAAALTLIRTSGDQDRQTPLRLIGGKGVFTKEIEAALLENRVDLAVHSMKDLPTTLPDGLVLGAVGKREDVRDALISRGGMKLADLPQGARVGTSSLRRQAQLRNRRPDLQMADVRGNVDTRIAKVERGEYDAVMLAKAGLDRLGMSGAISEVLPIEVCLPAAGQGAIGIEMRAPVTNLDKEIAITVGQLNDAATRIAVETERAVLAGLSGGCDLPLGVWAREEAGQIVVDACVLSVDGKEAVRVRRVGATAEAGGVAKAIVEELLGRGAERLIEQGRRSLGAG